ncbi:hypothetical protein NOR_02748 [Metarhizium rileyi]|uniref:Uncharacterized protein n=1 Tax=Metarhizium rileyi (strain RCEF 4871) TaxID=1649241 RepID=A0A167GUF2_METRR|nr:hypothetical protein NOR_02748 [Metarhizium rileyi RCEF 4871]
MLNRSTVLQKRDLTTPSLRIGGSTARFEDKVKNERHAIESVDVLEAAIKPCKKDYAQGQAQSRLRNSPTSLTCRAQTSFAHFELRDLHDGFGSSREAQCQVHTGVAEGNFG